MSAQRPIIRKAAQLVALAQDLNQGAIGDVGEIPHPTHWPSLEAEEARSEWEELRRWVALLRVRFPNLTRIPACWWRHNDLVEVLAALRDYERSCFSAIAPATASVEWQRALRDMELRAEIWVKRFTCGVGRGHDVVQLDDEDAPEGWDEFVYEDVERRRLTE